MVPVFLCGTALWYSIKLRQLKSATQQRLHEGAAAGLIKLISLSRSVVD